MKKSKKRICLLSLLVSSNLFASDYATNNLTVTNKYILEALSQNGKNKDPKKDVNSTTSSGDPIYNLFYLSRAIATNTNSLEALGYLNYLAKNNQNNSIINELRDSLNINIREELYSDLNSYFKAVLGVGDKIDDLEKNYKGIFSGKNNDIKKDIINLNNLIYSYRNIDIINRLNLFIKQNDSTNVVKVNSLDDFSKITGIIKKNDNNLNSFVNIFDDIIAVSSDILKKDNSIFFSKYSKKKDVKEKISFLKTDSNLVEGFEQYRSYYKVISNKRNQLVENLINNYLDNLTIDGLDVVYQIDQKQINKKIQDSRTVIQETNSEISGFKVPSQSDLINSVAQFMANRAKQETMIWFVQYLQKEIQNPLLWDAFPQTKEMLETFDLDRIKDLNENWRTSLSSDFVKMPTNLINSQWLANQAEKHGRTDELEVIQSSVKSVTYFQKLVNERNNYRSILKHFYEQSDNSELFKNQKNLKDITTLLYIVSNEFYTIQDKKMYYITSEQLNNISDEQWKYFLDLVQIKYGTESCLIFSNILGDKSSPAFKKKLVSLISDFSQIHALSKAAMDENHPSFNLAWNKMIDLLKYVDPNFDALNNNFNTSKYPEIDQLQSLYKIGQQIAKKDFKAATKGTLEFIKPLYANSDFNIEVKENVLRINKGSLDTLLSQNKKYTLEILDVNKFKKSDINLKDFSLKFGKNQGEEIIISQFSNIPTNCFSIFDIKNELKTVLMTIENNKIILENNSNLKVENNSFVLNKNENPNEYNFNFSEKLFLSKIFKPIVINSKKYKPEDINKYITNSLLLANLIVDLADNPLKVINNNNYEIFDIELEDIQDNLQNKSINKLIKTSMLFTDIFNARDEKGVYNAIDDMFSPKESYMIKRKHKRTFSVNGYVGLYGGYQFVQSQPSDYTNSFAYGITAPIGLTYSGKKFGVFVQFLELGNVVNHYLWSNADYSHKQKLSVKELFSPGLKVLYNIPKTPFVAFVGSSLVQVDKHYNDRNEIVNDRAFDLVQVTAGVKVDIPFFTMYKSNKSKKK